MRTFIFYLKKSSIDLHDWDVKEQENLREVERILERTDEILEVMHSLHVLCVCVRCVVICAW